MESQTQLDPIMCPLSLKEEFRVLRERRENRERGTPTYRLSSSIIGHTKKKDNRSKVSTRNTKKRDAKVSTH
mgnify:CR=1 FL=1